MSRRPNRAAAPRSLQRLRTLVGALVLALAACADAPPAPPASAPPAPPAPRPTAAGALSEAGVTFTSPPNGASYAKQAGALLPVTAAVEVKGFTLGTDATLDWYLDEAQVGHGPLATFTYADVPLGVHRLGARLRGPDGAQFDGAGAVASALVTVGNGCTSSAECQSNHPCWVPQCLSSMSGKVCKYGPMPATGCCGSDFDCTWPERCDGATHTCVECVADGDCEDGDPCTVGVCGPGGACVQTVSSPCCATNADCDDGNPCTAWTCEPTTGACVGPAWTPGCCRSSLDCGDGQPCTAALCVDQQCVVAPAAGVPGCCSGPGDPACDDGNPCSQDTCADFACKHGPLPPGGATPEVCCTTADDCADANPCTSQSCTAWTCVIKQKPACTFPSLWEEPLDVADTAALAAAGFHVLDPVTGPASTGWGVASGAPLGPDGFMTLGAVSGGLGAETCIAGPLVLAGTSAPLHAGWTWAYTAGAGVPELRVELERPGDPPLVIWSHTATGAVPPRDERVPADLGWGGHEVRLRFCARTPDTRPMGTWSIDDLSLGTGHAPMMHLGRPVRTVPLGEAAAFPLAASDADGDPVTLELVEAPPFVSLAPVEPGAFVSAQLEVAAVTDLALAGAHRVRLRASDGWLVSESACWLVVQREAGWLVWAPEDATPKAGPALVAVLGELGLEAQAVPLLSAYPRLSRFDGVLATLGMGPATHTPTEDERAALAAYLAAGGRLYVEGGDAFFGDPVGLDAAFGVTAPTSARSIDGPLSWTAPGLRLPRRATYADPGPLNQGVDLLAPVPGSGAEALLTARHGEVVAVARHRHDGTSTVASSVLLAGLAPEARAELLAEVVRRLSLGASPCKPSCEGRVCGGDGCGGSCGACGAGEACEAGACVCAPQCDGKECGPDGCGGSCGACGEGECADGSCACPAGTRPEDASGMACEPFVQVSAGASHTCAVTEAGALYCWGTNLRGQIGDGTKATRYQPVRVGADVGWSVVSCGEEHTCAIRGGELWCWGANSSAQLTTSDTKDRTTPMRVGTASDWFAVSAGMTHTCGLRAGTLSCWGANVGGAVWPGAGSPVLVPYPVDVDGGWQAVAAGSGHSCAIRDGMLFCWGSNVSGELGGGTLDPVVAPVLVGEGWTSVSAGTGRTCGVRSGELLCWGRNDAGELGSAPGPLTSPTPMDAAPGWESASVRGKHMCAVRQGAVTCWGDDENAQLGDGAAAPATGPVTTAGGWESVTVAASHTCGIRGGRLLCWGWGAEGRTGLGDVLWVGEPRLVSAGGWTSLSAKVGGTCGVRSGAVHCWGNYPPVVGYTHSSTVPAPVTDIVGATSVSVSPGLACAIAAGELRCWGPSASWLLDCGPWWDCDPASPIVLGPDAQWQEVAAGSAEPSWGGDRVCATHGGALYCWGIGLDGAVGAGPLNEITGHELFEPTLVDAGPGWHGLSASFGARSCAVRYGRLHCWGGAAWSSSEGTGTLWSPVPIGGATDWQWISTNTDHACGIRAGDLYCWGDDFYGQLGNGSLSDASAPSPAGEPGGWHAVATATPGYLVCGLRSGALLCWGKNELKLPDPDGSVPSKLTSPRAIGDATDWTALAVGPSHACGLRGGDLYCMGSNQSGQCGTGWTFPPTAVPIPVP